MKSAKHAGVLQYMVFSMVLYTIPYHTAMGMAVIEVKTFQTDLIRGAG